jgi:hypothetical protein
VVRGESQGRAGEVLPFRRETETVTKESKVWVCWGAQMSGFEQATVANMITRRWIVR